MGSETTHVSGCTDHLYLHDRTQAGDREIEPALPQPESLEILLILKLVAEIGIELGRTERKELLPSDPQLRLASPINESVIFFDLKNYA